MICSFVLLWIGGKLRTARPVRSWKDIPADFQEREGETWLLSFRFAPSAVISLPAVKWSNDHYLQGAGRRTLSGVWHGSLGDQH